MNKIKWMKYIVTFVFHWKACGLFFGDGAGPEWHSLRTTWGPNPFSHSYFVNQPLTVEDAKTAGFEQFSSGCEGEFIYSIIF